MWRDYLATHKQTVLGPLRYLVQPLVTTITLTVVFDRLLDCLCSSSGRLAYLSLHLGCDPL